LLLTQFDDPVILPRFEPAQSMPGKERQVSNPDRILVVDEASDTAEVLQAVLEARGVSVQRVRRLDPSAATADESCPAVVILNAESMDGTSPADLAVWQHVPQVIIGTVRIPAATAGASHAGGASRRVLRNPFQFAELLQAIESLIAARSENCALRSLTGERPA
jgi:DNA-binding response OmpR family regulator